MDTEGSTPEAETQVQESTPAPASTPAPKQHFFDRFSRGGLAAIAATVGLVVGEGGSAVVDGGHHGHDGWVHHRGGQFGMQGGGWGHRDGGPGDGRGGPPIPPGAYGGQAAPQGGVAPGAQQQAPPNQAPQAQQGTKKNGAYIVPPAAGSTSTY